MPARHRKVKVKQPSTKPKMPWGHDAPGQDITPLNTFVDFVTDVNVKPGQAGGIKNVLVYWDRGDLTRGDEAKMADMGINSNDFFAHVLDIQDWCKLLWPKGTSGNEKHSLGEAAAKLKIDTISQLEIDKLDDTTREYKFGAMKHNAGGDAEITLRVFIAIIVQKISDLNDQDGGQRKLRDDFSFIGLDFEGGGKTGQGTTEIGISQVYSTHIDSEYCFDIQTRHAIIWQHFDDHPRRTAQDGNMAIDDRDSRSYPRWNFTGGPNTTEKVTVCYPQPGTTLHQVTKISVDTELIYKQSMAWWLVHQIPGSSTHPSAPPYPGIIGPSLNEYTGCTHEGHVRKSHRRDVNGQIIRPPRQNYRSRRVAEESDDEDYHM